MSPFSFLLLLSRYACRMNFTIHFNGKKLVLDGFWCFMGGIKSSFGSKLVHVEWKKAWEEEKTSNLLGSV